MAILPWLNERHVWKTGNFPRPWAPGRPALYDDVQTGDGAKDLSDGDRPGPKIRFAAGAMDGAMGHHVAKDDPPETRAGDIAAAFITVIEHPTAEAVSKLYEALKADRAMPVVDALINEVSGMQNLDSQRLAILLRWLATKAPDRDPVKIAIALLGLYRTGDYREIFHTLGRHEEFTLYAAVALNNSHGNDAVAAEPDLFKLAKSVNGWGRIHSVERLAATTNPEIMAWMVRDGYRNAVMYEYLAFPCATAGNLVGELRDNPGDSALLDGAADIISALIKGGPAADIGDYEAAAEACHLFVANLTPDRFDSNRLLAISDLERFLQNSDDDRHATWPADIKSGLAKTATRLLESQGCREACLADLKGTKETFWTAHQLAKRTGLDAWPYCLERQKNGEARWFELMQTDDPSRIRTVVELAETTLPLEKIATGPALHSGLGPDHALYSPIDFILQGLGKFPGLGWTILRAALRSPVIRNRNLAVRTLSEWGMTAWPEEAQAIVETAEANEPDAKVKERFRRLLRGEPLEKPE